MKKSFCIFLCIIMLISSVPFTVFAAKEPDTSYPTIIVAGYSSSDLFLELPDGSRQKVWGVNIDDIIATALHKIAQLGIGLGGMAFGKTDYLADTVGKAMLDLYGVISCNPDGTSVNNISNYSKDPAKTNFTAIYETGIDSLAHEPEIMADVAAVYGENGYDNIFSFQCDFRMNITSCAAELDKYIKAVLEYTSADKVNLFAVSHGGEVCAVYFSLYGSEQLVNNAVLTVPAIGGAALAYDVMSENVKLDEDVLLRFIENGMMWEEDFDWLVKAKQLGVLDPLCNRLVRLWVKQLLGYWGSIWDFIPCEYYDELKERFLDPELNRELIKNSDYYHYELMPRMSASLNKCIEDGTNIYIVAGCDNKSVTGLNEVSDGIITVNSSTGAYCALPGTRFADGFAGLHTVCGDISHDHISPAMNIDASCAYIPEYTWFISGLFHGMTWKDDYTIDLCQWLLFSDETKDVYSDAKYPQFRYSTNVCYTVDGSFGSSAYGTAGESDKVFYITNLSEKYPLELKSVNCYGADLKFDVKPFTFLAPGETIAISISGSLPAKSLTTIDVHINYVLYGCITPVGCRALTFKLMNGEADGTGEGIASGTHSTPFDEKHSSNYVEILKKLGLFEWFRMIFNYFAGLINLLK